MAAIRKKSKSWLRKKAESLLVLFAAWSVRRMAPRLLKRYAKLSGGWVAVIAAILGSFLKMLTKK